MLEQPRLLIYPWAVAGKNLLGASDWTRKRVPRAEPIRRIADPSTGDLLGFARWRKKIGCGWLVWLAGQDLEILETEDASLLMTLRRPWGLWRTWEVLDAEERRVGALWRGVLWDAYGQRLATTIPPTSAALGKLVSPQQTLLASWRLHPDRTLELNFGQQTNPFVRMILLGALLLA